MHVSLYCYTMRKWKNTVAAPMYIIRVYIIYVCEKYAYTYVCMRQRRFQGRCLRRSSGHGLINNMRFSVIFWL